MKKFNMLLAIVAIGAIISGCSQDNLTISKCAKYSNGNCVSSKQIPVTKCSNPIKVGKETYCTK